MYVNLKHYVTYACLMKALVAAVIAVLALTHMGFTQRTPVDRVVLEGTCQTGLDGVSAGTVCTYQHAVMTGSVSPRGYEVSSRGFVHFVPAGDIRSVKAIAAPGDVLSTFTWRTWLMLAILLASLAVFYRETRGMIGMAFIRPSMTRFRPPR